MKSEALTTEDLRALEWYATMGVEAVMGSSLRGSVDNRSHSGPERESRESRSHPELDLASRESPEILNQGQDDQVLDLASLREAILNFEGCALKSTATNTVFGDGIPTSKIMLIGEAPGATEDAQGIPFCGESGKLLDRMIESIGLSRTKNVYITNTIFWRPPGNRAPTDQEIEACRPFVEQHIALINPELLILVGSTAVTSLLGKHLQISRIRQEYYQYTNTYLNKSITTTALFHPAYLLRQPMQKKTTWYDLLKIREFIEKNIKTC